MVTKGLIKSIDYNSNTCKVRLPLFENASQPTEVSITAIFSIQPGAINGYKEGDVVVVAFDGESISNPVVMGKLYLGAAEESKDVRGMIKCDSLHVASDAVLPLTTRLSLNEGDTNKVSVDGDANSYKTISDIVKALQQTEEKFTKASLDLDAQVAEIKVEYISKSTEISGAPDANDPGWQVKVPS
jgi:hypothetical protein